MTAITVSNSSDLGGAPLIFRQCQTLPARRALSFWAAVRFFERPIKVDPHCLTILSLPLLSRPAGFRYVTIGAEA